MFSFKKERDSALGQMFDNEAARHEQVMQSARKAWKPKSSWIERTKIERDAEPEWKAKNPFFVTVSQ